MFKIIYAILVSTLILIGSNIPTQAIVYPNDPTFILAQKKVDYCGIQDTWTQRIPEKPFGYNFAPYCQSHDECYALAEKKQNLAEINSAKRLCDTRFKQNLYNYCDNLASTKKTYNKLEHQTKIQQIWLQKNG